MKLNEFIAVNLIKQRESVIVAIIYNKYIIDTVLDPDIDQMKCDRLLEINKKYEECLKLMEDTNEIFGFDLLTEHSKYSQKNFPDSKLIINY